MCILPDCFHPFSETNSSAREKMRLFRRNASRSTLSSVQISSGDSAQAVHCLFDAHQGRFANKGHARSQDHASSHRLRPTNRQNANQRTAEHDCRQNVGQKCAPQRDAAESDQVRSATPR